MICTRQDSWRDPYVQLVLLAAIYMAARTVCDYPENPTGRSYSTIYSNRVICFIHACFSLRKNNAATTFQ